MPKAVRRTQVERKEISDAKMFEVAVNLIVDRGAANTTLKEVGEKAGYSRGLAGYRFGNKAGLFDFVLRSVTEDWLNELKKETAGKSGYQAIAAALDAHIRLCENTPKQVEAFYRLWFESLSADSQLKPTILAIHERRCSDVITWIEQGIHAGTVPASVNPKPIAMHFCTAAVGIVYYWMNNPEDLEQMRALHEELKPVMKAMLNLAG